MEGALTARSVPAPRWIAALPAFGAGLAALALAGLTWAIAHGLTACFDADGIRGLIALRRPWLDAAMIVVTSFAAPVMAVCLSLGVGFVAVRHYRASQGALLVAFTFFCGGVDFALKQLLHRARPDDPLGEAIASGFSFPSWHALASVAVFGGIALLLGRIFPRGRQALAWGAIGIAFVVGLSRIYLGAHWPTDVLAGYLAGWILLVGFAAGLDWLERRRARPT